MRFFILALIVCSVLCVVVFVCCVKEVVVCSSDERGKEKERK